ncbi:DUF1339 domain protein [Cordyceps fumosorosea ARSEF 2679]|uniref:DUF1339 domain protein n=1 Tax=Cordyceps fumosorosea (strain ARSEF 2679) TaxID=1081104 RepID=A0A167WM69_CORFA|nr:DUF1339 domain protein [Cordyceps fumosorosea ARSEF 2679]OAA63965.1 DUF1339 domain protein [Cordyceps fumosorosea ARSEF 2679]
MADCYGKRGASQAAQFFYTGDGSHVEALTRYRRHGLHPVILGDILPMLGTCVGDLDREPRYQIRFKLGLGAFATVWLAWDLADDRWVAVKLCQGSDSSEPNQEATILSELQTSGQGEPGLERIIKLFDFFTIKGPNGFHQCLVTEVVCPLNDSYAIDQCTSASVYQAIQGFAFLHEQGIAHGDPHPGNLGIAIPRLQQFDGEQLADFFDLDLVPVMPRSRSFPRDSVPAYATPRIDISDFLHSFDAFPSRETISVKILDFGRAHRFGQQVADLPGAAPLTFRPPEIVMRDKFDDKAGSAWSKSADLWAIGCLMHEMSFSTDLFSRSSALGEYLSSALRLGGPPPDSWPSFWSTAAECDADSGYGGPDTRKGAWASHEALFRNPPSKKRSLLLNLIQRVVVTNPDQRISARELLDDPFFAVDVMQNEVSPAAIAAAGSSPPASLSEASPLSHAHQLLLSTLEAVAMYWPIGTPRIYATSSNRASGSRLYVSHDGVAGVDEAEPEPAIQEENGGDATTPPVTPATPATPAVKSVEFGDEPSETLSQDEEPTIPIKDPVLTLRVSRSGNMFAVITATSITLWQTKPTVILAVVVRSQSSLQLYGRNVDLLLRPDSAILVVRTSEGYLITYSVATDGESRVYKSHFPNYHNVQRRRQSLVGPQAGLRPDQYLWGPGEGTGVLDVSVRFRMVIKVDAGIESALALDDELIVATAKPAAVQCIRWTPDSTGSQTRTEILSRMGWVEKKVCITEMTYDRPMNLSTWITSDGRVYAVQRHKSTSEDDDPKKLFKGHCFHTPEGARGHAVRAVINARFSLIAVGCSDGTVQVYSVRDYSGNITLSHSQVIPATTSTAGALTTLGYSPDGYCLFAGFENGWATWSMFGNPGSHSFSAERSTADEPWLAGVDCASWVGGGSEILMIGRRNEAIWSLEMAKSAVTGCYNDANVFRTVLQTSTGIMVYRGYDLPDMTSISAEPFLWHTARIPAPYLLHQWPIRQVVISPDGRYVAVAGRKGLAHYSVNSGRWKTFANEAQENEFQVRGGMCWYQHILVAAVEGNKSYEIRLYSRETALESSQVLFTQKLPAPIVLVTTSGEDSLLVYTYENLLYHFIFTPSPDSVRLVQVGQIAFHGIVRSPARVRGLSWILPESQLVDGDPSQDVAVASVIFLVDGKLVLLSPSLNEEGQLKYDMRIIAQNVEYHASMRDQPLLNVERDETRGPPALRDSLWVFDGMQVKGWASIDDVLNAASDGTKELPAPVSFPVDFYPLSMLLEKGIILGVESNLVQRRDVNFSFFRFTIRTHLVLPDLLRFYLRQAMTAEAVALSEQYQDLAYFSHGLEMLLHRVLEEESETSPPPAPEAAVLPRVLSLLSSSRDYLDVVLRCTRKTEVRQWRTLFAYLPPPRELFEESLLRGPVKTAGGYLMVLYTLDELGPSTEQSVRVLTRAVREADWELCRELARFLAALDHTGETLQRVMQMADLAAVGGQNGDGGIGARLEIPSGLGRPRVPSDGTESDERSVSEGSLGSTISPIASPPI